MWVLQAPQTETVKLQPWAQMLNAALWAQQTLTCVLQAAQLMPQLMWVLQSPHTDTVKLQPWAQMLNAALWAQQALTCVLQPAQLTTTLQAGHGLGP